MTTMQQLTAAEAPQHARRHGATPTDPFVQQRPWNHTMRRRRLLDTVTAASGALLTACRGEPAPAPAAPPAVGSAETTLVWQTELPADTLRGIDAFLSGWTQAHPRVKVAPLDVGGGEAQKIQKLLAMAAGGTPADVVGKLTFIQPLASRGAVAPLTPYVKRDRYDVSGYNPAWLTTFGSWDGTLFSLPWGLGGSAVGFIYSPAALAEADLAPPSHNWDRPWPWDQFREYARRLTRRQGDRYQRVGVDELGSRLYTIPMAFGARWLADDGRTVRCDAPEMVEAYTRYLELVLKDGSTPGSPGVDLPGGTDGRFAQGLAAMAVVGGWQMPTFTDPARYRVAYSFATFPKATYATPDMDTIQVAVGSGGRSMEEAWTFVKWLLAAGRYAALVFRMPTLEPDAAAWAKTAFGNVPASANVDVLVASLKRARAQDPLRAHAQVATVESEVLVPLLDDLWSSRQTVRDALSGAKRQIQTIIAGP
jgi:ABC-type glycerol-3-phosphate transport system substrate-binding protein